jgi:hypothetical protein
MAWSFSNDVTRVVRVGGCWLYLTWQNQSKKTFSKFVRDAKRLEKAMNHMNQTDRGIIIDTAADNTRVQDMLRRCGMEKFDEADGQVYFKKEVKSHV